MNVTANLGALIGTAVALLAALWTMASHFDKLNADLFSALEKQIEGNREQFEATKGPKKRSAPKLREMRAELRLEIREAGERRLIGGRPSPGATGDFLHQFGARIPA